MPRLSSAADDPPGAPAACASSRCTCRRARRTTIVAVRSAHRLRAGGVRNSRADECLTGSMALALRKSSTISRGPAPRRGAGRRGVRRSPDADRLDRLRAPTVDGTPVHPATRAARSARRRSRPRARRRGVVSLIVVPSSSASSGSSGSGECISVWPARRGRVSRNCAPRPRSPHACSQPSCSRASSSEIARPEAGAAGEPAARRVAAPEPVEHQPGLARPQPDAVIAHGDRDRVVVVADGDHDRLALAVVERVADEVAQDALDPAGRPCRRSPATSGSLDDRPRCRGARRAAGCAARRWRRRPRGCRPARTRGGPRRRRSARSRAGRRAATRTGRARRAAARPARDSSGGNSSRLPCRYSAAIRIVVSGVRSSCETSLVNRRCSRERSSRRRIWRCRLSAMSLNDCPSRAMSSLPRTAMRLDRSPPASRPAVSAATRTGRTTCRVTSSAMPSTSRTSASPASSTVRWTSAMVCSSAVSGNR